MRRSHPEKIRDKASQNHHKAEQNAMKANEPSEESNALKSSELVLQAFVRDGISMYGEHQQTSPTEEEQSLCSFQGKIPIMDLKLEIYNVFP